MKRLAFTILVLCCAPVVYAAASERDVLLTMDGIVYTAENQNRDDGAGHEIVLAVQGRGVDARTVVPESLSSGVRSAPALAYDPESQTLFVFWLRMPNLMSSELLISAYRDGKWDAPVSIDNKSFRLRYNLRIAVRHRVAQPQSDGSLRDVAAVVVHTVWWEQTGDGEMARYALVAIDKGNVANIELHDLSEFVAETPSAVPDPDFNRELLKHPAIIDSKSANSVDVLFGDLRTNELNRVTLRPIAEGRIHIPIGRGGGGRLGVPRSFAGDWSGRVSAVMGNDDGTLLLYSTTDAAVNFLVYASGTWSTVKSVPLNDKLTSDGAIAALTRMLNQ